MDTLADIGVVIALILSTITLITFVYKMFKWFDKQNAQDIKIQSIQEEQCVLTSGVLACLKGLKEQGCDGPVTQAIASIEDHLNQKAHRQ